MPSEQRAMDILDKTCRKVESGYELGLLWKANRPPLPNNYDTALKRLESVERRLLKDPKLAEGYRPSLHNDLPGILLRFRERSVALSGDVSDMFCHVRLRPEDCKYHQYPWRDMDAQRPPDVYEMNCLVFGDKSSTCEANFAVIRTTEDFQEQWPAAAAAVRRDIFVDELYTSCESEAEAANLRQDVTALMSKGGFPMRKWISSSPEVLATVPQAERAASDKNLELGELPSGRAL
ncbi:hypothetical protein QZH41_020718, partial [Actinostola sp. cb2023]